MRQPRNGDMIAIDSRNLQNFACRLNPRLIIKRQQKRKNGVTLTDDLTALCSDKSDHTRGQSRVDFGIPRFRDTDRHINRG